MIPVTPVPEPDDFDAVGRRPGNAWLSENAGAHRPRDFWTRFKPLLADGFRNRCGYTAMHEPVGTVDHLRSWSTHPDLSYEWSNYRFASGWINSAKKAGDILDPYVVGEGWFEILLPSMQLVSTERVPPEHRAIVEQTLARLPIVHDERVLRQRRGWYDMYRKKKLTLEGLRDMAPLIAAAAEKQLETSKPTD